MAKPKAKTIQQRFGFLDDDLIKPDHDEIMIWLDKLVREQHVLEALVDGADVELREVVWEFPINSKGYIIGFVDMVIGVSFYDSLNKHNQWLKIGFEVKTEIPSLGELFRQLRMYQSYTAFSNPIMYVVVSPENKFTDQLIEQGIGYMNYPDGWILMPGEPDET